MGRVAMISPWKEAGVPIGLGVLGVAAVTGPLVLVSPKAGVERAVGASNAVGATETAPDAAAVAGIVAVPIATADRVAVGVTTP
jgi:hypothetical protein